MPNVPPRMICAALRLTAMTLRGLGPYLHGARLEIRRLTILCGENGSGKSTWIDALRVLSSWAVSKNWGLPELSSAAGDDESDYDDESGSDGSSFVRLGLHSSLLVNDTWRWADSTGNSDRETNERERLRREAMKTRLQSVANDEQTRNYGPVGCIGLHADICDMQAIADAIECHPELWNAIKGHVDFSNSIVKSHQMRLRIASPREPSISGAGNAESERVYAPDGLLDWFEIEITGRDQLVIRYQKPSDAGDPLLAGRRPCVEIIASSNLRSPPVAVEKWDEGQDGFESLRQSVIEVFRTLVLTITSGVFPIGPIRQIHKLETVSDAPDIGSYNGTDGLEHDLGEPNEDGVNKRYVGYDGRDTQRQYVWWSYNQMRQPEKPFTGAIDSSFTTADFDWSKHEYELGPRDSRRMDVWSGCPVWLRKQMESLAGLSNKNSDSHGVQPAGRTNELAVELLNRMLDNRNLIREFMEHEQLQLQNLRREAKELIARGVENLAPDEVRRLNRLLLESTFGVDAAGLPHCVHRTGYVLETFVSYWMKQLVDTSIQYCQFPHGSLDRFWADHQHPPNGLLIHPDQPAHFLTPGPHGTHEPGLAKSMVNLSCNMSRSLRSRTGTADAAWHVMSTGFHQVAPIIVQAGLMLENELLTIENPEAHLHPSLQLRIAEFLMHQANAGKLLLIETHSDLFVRRVMRAIIEEDVNIIAKPQEAVAIHFTRLDVGEKYATVETLQFDDNDQIVWPPDFMNDYIKESRRLLEAMYGTGSEEENDGT